MQVDFTDKNKREALELKRAGADALPVNLIYPPNYPAEPAIKLSPNLLPGEINRVLDRMEKIVQMEKS